MSSDYIRERFCTGCEREAESLCAELQSQRETIDTLMNGVRQLERERESWRIMAKRMRQRWEAANAILSRYRDAPGVLTYARVCEDFKALALNAPAAVERPASEDEQNQRAQRCVTCGRCGNCGQPLREYTTHFNSLEGYVCDPSAPVAPVQAQAELRHGRDCPKVAHTGRGYLHDFDDD